MKEHIIEQETAEVCAYCQKPSNVSPCSECRALGEGTSAADNDLSLSPNASIVGNLPTGEPDTQFDTTYQLL